MKIISFGVRFASVAFAAVALASCSGGGTGLGNLSGTAPATTGTFSVRALAASPDAGPVDVYIYSTTGAQPAKPLYANVQYPGMTAYVALPTGSYTISFDRAGTLTQLATEALGGTTNGTQVSAALAGQVGTSTLQLQNFIEPLETSGTTALVVHHASPAIDAQTTPIGIAAYPANSSAVPGATFTSQLFTFALTASTALAPGTSGSAATGSVNGGEYFVSPIASTLPSPLGFAAGAPGTSGALSTVIAASTLSGLATNLNTVGYGRSPLAQTLAGDTSNTISAGAHLSVFAIDSTTSAPGILIGTLDP